MRRPSGMAPWFVSLVCACGDDAAKSGDSDSADSAPADTAPADTAPADTAPADTAPADTAPADTAPVDTTPADTTPEDTTPADTADTSPLPLTIGIACAADGDCGASEALNPICVLAGPFWTDGYCAAQGCRDSGACPDGSHCGFLDAIGVGFCVDSCAGDGDCTRDHYGCWDIDRDGRGECAPSSDGAGAPGATCESMTECAGGERARCLVEPGESAGVCAIECTTLDACPDGTRCSFRGGDGFGLCISTCSGDADCDGGFSCADRDHDGADECWIAGDGPLSLGEPCVNAAECGLGPESLCLGGANFPQAFCSAACVSDAECTAAGHCVAIAGGLAGFCLEDCVDASGCPEGLGCVDPDGDGRKECGPLADGQTALGRRCATAGDCAGGDGWFCAYPELVCRRFCVDDAVCGGEGHCLFNGDSPLGLCAPDCADDSDCEQGNHCVDANADGQNECWVTGHGETPLGGPCSASPNCGPGLVCVPGGPGAQCTFACNEPSDCPLGGRCSEAQGGGLDLCLAECDADADCREAEGWRCFDGDGDGASECRPFAGGAGAIGAQCATTADCSGGEDAFCLGGRLAPSGTCTRRCAAPADCAAGSSCVSVPGYDASKLCIADCSEGCRADWQCTSVDPDVSAEVCLDGCTSDADCRFDMRHPRCDTTRDVCVE